MLVVNIKVPPRGALGTGVNVGRVAVRAPAAQSTVIVPVAAKSWRAEEGGDIAEAAYFGSGACPCENALWIQGRAGHGDEALGSLSRRGSGDGTA